jgi:hypothetical protein
MKLKSFGCSFIFGTDLSDDGRDLPAPTASQLTWPAHLAKNLEYSYGCYARPGSGNLQIAERVLSHAAEDQSSLFVIGWTWIDRFDHTNSTINNHPMATQWSNWRTVMPIDRDQLANFYYKGLHSEFRDKLVNLMYIKLVIDTLQQKQIAFLMTYMDDLLFCQQHNVTHAVLDLQKYIRPYMTNFNNQTFLNWSRSNGFPVSDTLHPLEQAHRAAADYMITIFDKQKIIDLTQPARV